MILLQKAMAEGRSQSATISESDSLTDHLTEPTRTNMSLTVFNCSRAVWKYRRHIDSCDSSDNNDSSDSRQEQTRLKDFLTGSLI